MKTHKLTRACWTRSSAKSACPSAVTNRREAPCIGRTAAEPVLACRFPSHFRQKPKPRGLA